MSVGGIVFSAKPKAPYRGRLDRFTDDVWLIWSNKWGCWYRPDSCGYTQDVGKAGLYTREEAAEHYQEGSPRKYRDTEPFPLSSVRKMLLTQAAHLRAEADRVETMASGNIGERP